MLTGGAEAPGTAPVAQCGLTNCARAVPLYCTRVARWIAREGATGCRSLADGRSVVGLQLKAACGTPSERDFRKVACSRRRRAARLPAIPEQRTHHKRRPVHMAEVARQASSALRRRAAEVEAHWALAGGMGYRSSLGGLRSEEAPRRA